MKWKKTGQLLGPTPIKLALFVLLFLLFVPFALYETPFLCNGGSCTESGSIILYGLHGSENIIKYHVISIFVGLVSSYLISCLVISLATSMRKK